jgi:peptide-methionine (R)-S-oxide reductase
MKPAAAILMMLAAVAAAVLARSMFGCRRVEPLAVASDPAEGSTVERIKRSDEEWREMLTPEQYRILRRKGTEPAHSSPLNEEKREGVFVCAACGLSLYSSEAKYESGTGWPSFHEPVEEGHVATAPDNTLFMRRTEVLCARCGGHLGHVFEDGPPPTGLRYCMNGLALAFEPDQGEGPP